MQFKSTKYINSVESFSNACITKQKRMSNVLVSVLLEKRTDMGAIVTSQGGIKKAVTDVIEKDVAKEGGTVKRGTLVQTWQSVMNGYNNGLPTGKPGLYKLESGEWEFDPEIIDSNIEGILSGKIRVGSKPSDKAGSKGGKRAVTAVAMLEKVEKMTKRERDKLIDALNAKYS